MGTSLKRWQAIMLRYFGHAALDEQDLRAQRGQTQSGASLQRRVNDSQPL